MTLKSTFLSLGLNDFLKGAVLAVIVPALLAIREALQNPPLNWKAIGITALATFIGYLIKNLFTDTNAAAVKTVEKAGGNVTPNLNMPQ